MEDNAKIYCNQEPPGGDNGAHWFIPDCHLTLGHDDHVLVVTDKPSYVNSVTAVQPFTNLVKITFCK